MCHGLTDAYRTSSHISIAIDSCPTMKSAFPSFHTACRWNWGENFPKGILDSAADRTPPLAREPFASNAALSGLA